VRSFAVSSARIALIPCPTNHGIATLATIAIAASANDQMTPLR
jgi:hypothetical protein